MPLDELSIPSVALPALEAWGPDIRAVQQIGAVPRILEVVCRLTGMGFAAVARVTDERWICCAVRDQIDFGLKPGGELDLKSTICHEIRLSHEAVAIDDVATDTAYCGHHTPAQYGFQSYISVPIILADGSFFGTLCAIDPHPAKLNNPETIGTFTLFAELIASQLDSARSLAQSEATLLDERATSELREQFIAVLGHDLRNPLASIAAGVRMLSKRSLDDSTKQIAELMRSSIDRMSRLIDDVLDFARGRLGGGLTLQRDATGSLEAVLLQVVAECRSSAEARIIETHFDLKNPVYCDASRIGQLLSNLVGNALTHGSAYAPVRVAATTDERTFAVSVINSGQPIPPEAIARLFQPFYRASDDKQASQGLGLGLYIASEIARAHGGRLDVESSVHETRFTFTMPIDSQTHTTSVPRHFEVTDTATAS